MNAPDSDFVTWVAFKWVVGGLAAFFGLWLTGVSGLVSRLRVLPDTFEKHLIDDDRRFDVQRADQLREHAENQKGIADLELRLVQGQQRIESKLDRLVFRELDEKK